MARGACASRPHDTAGPTVYPTITATECLRVPEGPVHFAQTCRSHATPRRTWPSGAAAWTAGRARQAGVDLRLPMRSVRANPRQLSGRRRGTVFRMSLPVVKPGRFLGPPQALSCSSVGWSLHGRASPLQTARLVHPAQFNPAVAHSRAEGECARVASAAVRGLSAKR